MKYLNIIYPKLVRQVVVFIVLIVSVNGIASQSKNPKQKKITSNKKSSTIKSTKGNLPQKTKVNNSHKKRVKLILPTIETLTDTVIDRGIRYRHFLYGRHRHSVHVAEISTTDQSLKLGLIKALDRIDGLERLGDMSIRHDSTSRDSLLVGINANFWKAYRNTPIGPMVAGGEVIHLHSYKLWSSAFFDARNRMTIDRFTLSGRLQVKNKSLNIDYVNERLDSMGIVVYNTYGGISIPYISTIDLEKAAAEFLQNHSMVTEDSTETVLNMDTLKQELTTAKREATIEYPMKKVTMRYLNNPAINREISCVVTSVDSGALRMPMKGCIVSFGKDFPNSAIPRKGDTVSIKFATNKFDTTQFITAVSGTPRIVRYGTARHEAMIEGSHAKRFLNQNLARTAIGTDKYRTKNYFVIVEANNELGKGATLAQMATIMKVVGSWNAMNLDGGGSAMMIVCGANACTNSTVPSGRKISAALGVFRKYRNNKSIESER